MWHLGVTPAFSTHVPHKEAAITKCGNYVSILDVVGDINNVK